MASNPEAATRKPPPPKQTKPEWGMAWSEMPLEIAGWKGIPLARWLKSFGLAIDRFTGRLPLAYTDLFQERNAHDYIVFIERRNATEQMIKELPLDADGKAKAFEAFAKIDEKLDAFTEPDADGRFRRFAARLTDVNGPWWDRIPMAGPAREEIDAFAITEDETPQQ